VWSEGLKISTVVSLNYRACAVRWDAHPRELNSVQRHVLHGEEQQRPFIAMRIRHDRSWCGHKADASASGRKRRKLPQALPG
jgi:hypothetical protein